MASETSETSGGIETDPTLWAAGPALTPTPTPREPLDGSRPALDVELALEFEQLNRMLGFGDPSASISIDGRYRIESTLGQGAMGVVLRAWDERLGRRVAVKLVRRRIDGDVALLQARLEREAQMLARVDSPNVVGVYDVGSHQGRVYVAMQYVAGSTARAWQAAQPRRPDEILGVYLQAARGLAAAHAGGVVHRDFKPDNMIVGDDGVVRVLDFGIAGGLQTPEGLDARASTLAGASETLETDESGVHLTRTGAILGTLAYMAPEQLRGCPADGQSDQFGFCVALWEALANQRPFSSRAAMVSPSEYHRTLVNQELDPRVLPRGLRKPLCRGLSPDPAERFASMAELISALERSRKPGLSSLSSLGVGALGLVPLIVMGWLLAADSTTSPARPAARPLADAHEASARDEASTRDDASAVDEAHKAIAASIDQPQPSTEPEPLPPQQIRYRPREGETWSDLAERFEVSLQALHEANPTLDVLRPDHDVLIWIVPKPPRAAKSDFDRDSLSIGKPNEGRILGAIQLPENDLLYLRKNPNVMWCTTHTARALLAAISSLRSTYHFEGTLVVADISKPKGGHFAPHQSHQSGRDVDIWLPMLPGVFEPERLDRGREPEPAEVDWYATYRLIEALRDTQEVESIFLEYGMQAKVFAAAMRMGASKEALTSTLAYPNSPKSRWTLVQHSDGYGGTLHVRFSCGPLGCPAEPPTSESGPGVP